MKKYKFEYLITLLDDKYCDGCPFINQQIDKCNANGIFLSHERTPYDNYEILKYIRSHNCPLIEE